MTITTKKAVLTDSEALKEVIDCLIEYLPIETQKAYCNQKDIHQIMVGAASQSDTIEMAAKKLKKSYTGKTIRTHLNNFKSFKEL